MRTTDYKYTLVVRVPTGLIEILTNTAKNLMTTKSEYVRQALITKLAKDGVILQK